MPGWVYAVIGVWLILLFGVTLAAVAWWGVDRRQTAAHAQQCETALETLYTSHDAMAVKHAEFLLNRLDCPVKRRPAAL